MSNPKKEIPSSKAEIPSGNRGVLKEGFNKGNNFPTFQIPPPPPPPPKNETPKKESR